MTASDRTMSRRFAGDHDGHVDSGYVIMLTALLIFPILAFTGFAVDLGAWYAKSARIQRASEAAALAGVTYMPDFTRAEQVARDVAAANGFPAGGDITIDVQPAGEGLNAIKVTITDSKVEQYFTTLFVEDVAIGRAAVAEYVSPIRMGSPQNYLGNDPVTGNTPNFWLVTFGQNSPKGQGDRFHTIDCSGGAMIGCNGSSNAEYQRDGYYFTVPVKGTPPGNRLRFQVFDPFFYDYNNSCNVSWLPTAETVANASGFYATNFPYTKASGEGSHPDYARWRQRFARGNTTWCAGDSDGNHGTFPEPETTFIVREPSSDPFDPTAGNILCAVKYPPIDVTDENDFRNKLRSNNTNNWDAVVLVDNTGGTAAHNESLTFERGWRRWIDLCSVSGGQVREGEYVIQVRTNVTTNPNVAGIESSKGNGRYALRAGFDTGTTDVLGSNNVSRTAGGASVSIGAISRLPVFVNTGGAGTQTEFYMARVTPEYRGKRLVLDIYDTTDGNTLNRIELVPTADATYNPGGGAVPLTEWPECDWFRVSGSLANPTRDNIALGQASGMALVAGSSCAIRANQETGNGYAIRAEIDIPTTYDCNEDDPFGCWVRMKLHYAGAPTDTTTWSASIDGDPVRLTG